MANWRSHQIVILSTCHFVNLHEYIFCQGKHLIFSQMKTFYSIDTRVVDHGFVPVEHVPEASPEPLGHDAVQQRVHAAAEVVTHSCNINGTERFEECKSVL